jgi:DNA-binding transcriptional ArsR family regulator
LLLTFNDASRTLSVMKSPSRALISRQSQLSVLASPARQEILDVLTRTGPAAVAELGALLGRPADGLYYHLRALQRARLVVEAGERIHRGRKEALYRTVHAEPKLRHDPSPGGNTPGVVAIVASMLRLGIRDFRRAAADRFVRVQGPRRELWALRATGWLSPAQVAVVNRRIAALRTTVSGRRPGARLYAITILLTPLDHRARRKRNRSRR